MCSINWTKSRGHILFYKILSKRSHWAVKDEEPCLFYCKDTPNSLGGMRLLQRNKKEYYFVPIWLYCHIFWSNILCIQGNFWIGMLSCF